MPPNPPSLAFLVIMDPTLLRCVAVAVAVAEAAGADVIDVADIVVFST